MSEEPEGLLRAAMDQIADLETLLGRGEGPGSIRKWAMAHFRQLAALEQSLKRAPKAHPPTDDGLDMASVMLDALETADDPETTLQSALGALVELTDAARGFIAIPAPGRGLYFPAAVAFAELAIDAPEAQISRTILEVALRGIGRSFSIEDAQGDPRFEGQPSVVRLDLRAVLVVPLLDDDGSAFGVLYLDNPTRAAAFDEGRRRAAEVFAALVAPRLAARQAKAARAYRLASAVENQSDGYLIDEYVGSGEACHRVLRDLVRVAPSDAPVLISGETGSGKTLIARLVHLNSTVGEGPLVTVDCADLGGTSLRERLVGSGGAVTEAAGGTLVLERVDALDGAAQSALLALIDDGKVPARLVSTTTTSLRPGEAFSDALIFRLSAVELRVPPLRARMDDLRLMCDELLRREMKRSADKGTLALSMEAERVLQLHGWPGNVRELEQALRAAASRAGDGVIRPEHLPDSVRGGDQDAEDLSLKPAVRAFRLRYVQRIIEDKQGDLKAAAKALGVHPKYIYKLLRDMED